MGGKARGRARALAAKERALEHGRARPPRCNLPVQSAAAGAPGQPASSRQGAAHTPAPASPRAPRPPPSSRRLGPGTRPAGAPALQGSGHSVAGRQGERVSAGGWVGAAAARHSKPCSQRPPPRCSSCGHTRSAGGRAGLREEARLPGRGEAMMVCCLAASASWCACSRRCRCCCRRTSLIFSTHARTSPSSAAATCAAACRASRSASAPASAGTRLARLAAA